MYLVIYSLTVESFNGIIYVNAYQLTDLASFPT